MLKIVEVNDNDIYGKIFNGYDIMEHLNEDKDFCIKQLVLNKFSDNNNVERFMPDDDIFMRELRLHNLEHDIVSVHSLLSITNECLKNTNSYNEADLAHFHQVHNCHFSLDDFFDMVSSKPSVISLHDPWFVTGRCVHPKQCDKWKSGCKKCLNLDTFFDLPEDNCAELWNIKSKIADTDIDLIVHSKFMYDLVKQSPYLSKLRVHLVPFGVDIDKYTFELSKEEAKKKLNILPSDFVIFLRENQAFKGTEYALEAFKKLDVNKNITILTCHDKDQLIGLEDKYNVVKLGVIDEEKVRECYNASDLFLMPSPAESFGMMAVEAMASEVPVLVFDNTALPSTTGAPEYGILVKNLDANDLCEKMKYYIEHPDELKHRGKISREFVIKNYNYEEYFNKIKEVYNEAYEKQSYKIDKKQTKEDEIDYKDLNSQRVLKKLNDLCDNLFVNKDNCPSLLSNYKKSDNKKIEFSDSNVLNIINQFNKEMYSLLLDRNIVIKENEEVPVNVELPKVSIVIPVYNGENYVTLAIDSALRQTYPNVEIVVVNDGSTDKTDKICRSYGNRIKYIKKENGGVSTALNVGIENMTGDYFSWLSHDDLYYPNKVEVEVNYLLKNNLVGTDTILYSDYSIINEHGDFMFDVEFNSKYLNRYSAYPMLFGSIDGLSLLIPKKAFDEVGLFDKNLRCVQDYQLWYQMFKEGYEYVHIPEVTVSTRIHSKQVTNTSPKVVTEGNKYWVDLLNDFSDKEKIKYLGSEFNYWYNLHKFFLGGPYNEAIDLCEKEYNKIIDKHKNDNSRVTVIVNLNGSSSSNLKCLKSVLDQTYKNIEYLIYSNGKLKDFDVLEQLNKDDYKIIESKMSDSEVYNDGIKNAKGKYVTFIDSNSYYSNDKIEKEVSLIQCSKNNMVYSSYYKNKNNYNELVDAGFYHWQVDYMSKEALNINLNTVMIDRKAIIDNNIKFDNSISSGEDTVFIIDVLKLGYPMGIVDPLVVINDNDKNNYARISNVINHLIDNEDITIDDININGLIDNIYNNKIPDMPKHIRLADLERYKYFLTPEYEFAKKFRNVKSRLLHHEDYFSYDKPMNMIQGGKPIAIYRMFFKKKEKDSK